MDVYQIFGIGRFVAYYRKTALQSFYQASRRFRHFVTKYEGVERLQFGLQMRMAIKCTWELNF